MMIIIVMIMIIIFLRLRFIKHSWHLKLYTSLETGSVRLAICFDTIIKRVDSEKLVNKNTRL